jgi:hypothetical protein
MYDGSCKNVEDIQVDELLMGPDSKPRRVMELHRGRQQMVKIIPTKGEPFVVNLDHVLSLQRTKTGNIPGIRKDFRGHNPILNVSVREWIKFSKTKKHTYKLYRTGVNFPNPVEVPIPPYILGLWLGDGSHDCVEITTMDEPIRDVWFEYAASNKLEIKTCYKGGTNKAKTYLIKRSSPKFYNRPLLLLQELKLIRNKHIPEIYLRSSRENRLQILAGLIDTDGHNGTGYYDIIQKNKRLADEITFLARSLGFAAYCVECKKASQTKKVGTYHRVIISGNLEEVPVLLERKKCSRRMQIKSVLRTGFSIEHLPEDDYFGFSVTNLEVSPGDRNL